MLNCSSCVHFRSPALDDWNGEFGRCGRFPNTGSKSSETYDWEEYNGQLPNELGYWNDGDWMKLCHPDSLAFTADASQYSSAFYVRPEFGCVQHEANG
jgi:hypothetical protein